MHLMHNKGIHIHKNEIQEFLSDLYFNFKWKEIDRIDRFIKILSEGKKLQWNNVGGKK